MEPYNHSEDVPELDADFLISRLESAGALSPGQASLEGILQFIKAYAERLPGATPDDTLMAANVVLARLANYLDQGYVPGAVKQHGSGWRFRAVDVKIEDELGADE